VIVFVDSDPDFTRVMGVWSLPPDPGMTPESYYPLELERQSGLYAMMDNGETVLWDDWADQLEEQAPYRHWWWIAEVPAQMSTFALFPSRPFTEFPIGLRSSV
jgi:hypothetical protein